MKKQLLALSLSAIATMSMAQTPAFPGAEGNDGKVAARMYMSPISTTQAQVHSARP